jgi:hypothetical protein
MAEFLVDSVYGVYCEECREAGNMPPWEKKCKCCGRVLPIEEFKTAASHSPHCRECRFKKWDARQQRRTVYFKTQITRERQRAGNALTLAVNAGKVTRSPHCQICGRECKTFGHHVDYDRPLDVIWLCSSCHRRNHEYLSRESAVVQVNKAA